MGAVTAIPAGNHGQLGQDPEGMVVGTRSCDVIPFWCISQFWDLRTPTPVLSLDLPERCFCMDVVRILFIARTHSSEAQTF